MLRIFDAFGTEASKEKHRVMGLFTLLLIVIVILAIIGLGWKSFSSGVISGFKTVLDVGQPVIKNLTQEARNYVNNANMIVLYSLV